MFPHSGYWALILWCLCYPTFASAESIPVQPEAAETRCEVPTKRIQNVQENVRNEEEQVFEPGGDVKPPKLVHYVEPAFSRSSKEAFVEGVVRIITVVGTNGTPGDLHVASGLNSEEDQTALDAVIQWRFEPGSKNGHAVKVRVTVEVDFHLL